MLTPPTLALIALAAFLGWFAGSLGGWYGILLACPITFIMGRWIAKVELQYVTSDEWMHDIRRKRERRTQLRRTIRFITGV